MTAKISLVIPTHNRRELLCRNLKAIARQTLAADSYEVIVVCDGCHDETALALQQLDLPFSLKVLEQPAEGAAAARNKGATEASHEIIVFLDDDMEAHPGLLQAHRDSHQRYPGAVVLGYFSSSRSFDPEDIFVTATNIWWSDHFSDLAKPHHRFDFTDLCTGNMSVNRELFWQVGGFDTAFKGKAGEDYELGLRLLKAGAQFRFNQVAASIHHDQPSSERFFARAVAEGKGHIVITRKHPEAFMVLPIRLAFEGAPWINIYGWRQLRPWMIDWFPKLLKVPLMLTRHLKLRRSWQRFHSILHSCGYWKGVFSELGSSAELQKFTQEMPNRPESYRVLEIDLAPGSSGFVRLDQLIDLNQTDAIAVHYHDTPVGWLEPQAGAEPLRWPHIRHALIHHFSYDLLNSLPDRSVSLLSTAPAGYIFDVSGPAGLSLAVSSEKSPDSE
jgi:GT2 family glycosyltransferase